METTWFVLVSLSIAVYAATDGYDLGVGILAPRLARHASERAALRDAILGTWAANEVWLIALGGLFFLAFPQAYATAFSGFYLAFMILLWCLIGRGLAIEIRSHLDSPVWRTACDILFPAASFLVAFALGAATGNVLRGVPLDAQGRMFLPLWINLSLGAGPAIFDWYTMLVGFLAVSVFALHGGNFLAYKTEGDLRRRAGRAALEAAVPAGVLILAIIFLSPWVNPALAVNYRAHPGMFTIFALLVAAFVATVVLNVRGKYLSAFAASGLLIVALAATVAMALYPNLLPGRPDPQYSLTVSNSSTSTYGLTVALIWFLLGLGLVGFYMVVLYRLFADPVARAGSAPSGQGPSEAGTRAAGDE
jgi:cytochrome d ubiquinol oxidase subunit II